MQCERSPHKFTIGTAPGASALKAESCYVSCENIGQRDPTDVDKTACDSDRGIHLPGHGTQRDAVRRKILQAPEREYKKSVTRLPKFLSTERASGACAGVCITQLGWAHHGARAGLRALSQWNWQLLGGLSPGARSCGGCRCAVTGCDAWYQAGSVRISTCQPPSPSIHFPDRRAAPDAPRVRDGGARGKRRQTRHCGAGGAAGSGSERHEGD
jgi:hypothetical protein